jgi:hypothetical protein
LKNASCGLLRVFAIMINETNIEGLKTSFQEDMKKYREMSEKLNLLRDKVTALDLESNSLKDEFILERDNLDRLKREIIEGIFGK